jgi:hypothetical protein
MAQFSARAALADLGLDLDARRCDDPSVPIVAASNADKYFEQATINNPSLSAWNAFKPVGDQEALAMPEMARGQSHRRALAGVAPVSVAAPSLGAARRLKVPADDRNRVRRTMETPLANVPAMISGMLTETTHSNDHQLISSQ